MRRRIREWLTEQLYALLKAHFQIETAIRENEIARERRLTQADIARLEGHLTALQALDIGFKDKSYVVVIGRFGERDYVNVQELPRDMTMRDLSALSHDVERRYGARKPYIDAPGGVRFLPRG